VQENIDKLVKSNNVVPYSKSKKEEDEVNMFALPDSLKKKKKEKKEKKTKEEINLDPAMIAIFAKHAIVIPLTISDAAKIIPSV